MTTTKHSPNRTSMPSPVAGALDEILDYLWPDEERNFSHAAPEDQNKHIFHSLSVVRNWLAGGEDAE